MGDAYLAYQRARFRTRLPKDRLFTEGHFWLLPGDGGVHRVGFTRFATRMLGEMVEFEFEARTGDPVEQGQAVGWFEGFKAVTDLYTPLAGRFEGPNPELEAVIDQIHRKPYDLWLYGVDGAAPKSCMDADGYAAFLDGTIDRMTGRSA